MDELFVEAVLYSMGISNPKGYQEVLNTLWESASSELEPILLDLEALKYKGAMDYLLALLEGSTVDEAVFGKHLTKRLRELYELLPLADFAKKAYIVWAHLPQSLRDHDPFYILSYADDCLSYGDEVRCRELLEERLSWTGKCERCSQMDYSGMILEQNNNIYRYRCNDTGKDTDFKKLVFEIELL